MEDYLLKTFSEKHRWIDAIETGVQKGIDKSLLRELCVPENRVRIYQRIRDGTYKIAPPHEAQIPKDDGTYRIVYVNEGIDRVLLSIFNDMLFELCPELIHPKCQSYQKGIGCGKIVQNISKQIQHIQNSVIGVKVDLSKYFDSVPIEYIDNIFNYVQNKFGKSKILDAVWEYYHDDTIIDIHKNIINKYSSLRQGCAVAAFLADAVLFDIDDAISKLDALYVRYSDDILILGNDWEKGYDILKQMLAEKTLVLNPKKVEILQKNKWFKFLGFSIKDDKISLSKMRIKSFQKEIEKRTIKSNATNLKSIVKSINQYLYKGDGTYSWATSVLPIINTEKDINTLNSFVMDAIRATITKRKNIGGLGFVSDKDDFAISRGKGRNVNSNKEKCKKIDNYMSIACMRNALLTSKEAYNTLIMTL